MRDNAFKEAEECLTQSNIYDPQNPEIWGSIAILCLLIGNRFEQVMHSLKQMFKFEIENFEILEELGDLLYQIKRSELA